MENGGGGEFEERAMALAEAAEGRGDPPLVWAAEAARCAHEAGVALPSPELAAALVSRLCFARNSPALWKLLDQALASRLLSPLHTLALLTARIVPNRKVQPEAYRLYLELLMRYCLTSSSIFHGSCKEKIIKAVDHVLQLSRIYMVYKMDSGHVVVLFFLNVITNLIDSTLEDWGLQPPSTEKHGSLYASEAMDVDSKENLCDKKNEHREKLRETNSRLAIEVLEKITLHKRARIYLRLIHLNMPENFNHLLQRLQFIEVHKSTSQCLISANHTLSQLSMNIHKAMNGGYYLKKQQLSDLIDVQSCSSSSCHSSGAGRSAIWIPFDLFMENVMDGRNFHAISSIEILAELIKTLQVINRASWQETFQAMWVSALRLVQRDREPFEGPIPQLDARMCMLLSIVPLAIFHVLNEEREIPTLINGSVSRTYGEQGTEGNKYASRRHGLVSALQLIAEFSGLLLPPSSLAIAANDAASKAAIFISNFKKGSGSLGVAPHNDSSVKAVGNMLHLIVEACIARKLVDTSAYLWPGYVVASAPLTESVSVQDSPWSIFMKGAPLTDSLRNALIITPASSILELEKLYHIALNGSEDEKLAAAKILCGASLTRGWNIQEHVVHIVVKLLSPPVPPDLSRSGSHLVGHMSMLNAIMVGISCIDIIHILSLYGMVPEVAAALMPICEAFGSLPPLPDLRSSTSSGISPYSVFSCAFLFLLRLWKFYRPPQEHCIAGRGGITKPQLTLDYLLLLRNSRISLQKATIADRTNNVMDPVNALTGQPVYIDSFPKLRAWYFQNQACIAATLSGLSSKNPVHQVANKILSMICWKITKGGTVSSNPSSSSGSSINGSPLSAGDDAQLRPVLPAWEVLEAIPFVLEAILTACAHGRISSRDLTTGLRDLVDFLPASLATIISYFSAEISRGMWKPVPMNGTDWPSPAANLLSVESEIQEILESAGVHIPSCYSCGTTPVMLPLPMAALVSLTITFKLDRSLEYIHGVVGQALEHCATGFSWPSMPIIGALWTQKARRWHDFIILACARSPFTQDKEAITQLIRSCFSSFLGPRLTSKSHLEAQRGAYGLLGQAISEAGFRLPITPGFLYLRSCRLFHDTHFVNDVIFGTVVEWAHELATGCACEAPVRLRAGRYSLGSAATRVKEVAYLGASLLCITGGLQLVQVLYEETLPTFLLSTRDSKPNAGLVSHIFEGYAMAYMLVLCGAFVWGAGGTSPSFASVFSSRRARSIGIHMDFVAWVLEGNISMVCDPMTWKAYVSCLVGFLVTYLPAWVAEVKQETLWKLASGLRGWDECDLALALLERGGPPAMSMVVESAM